mmetsp:Transcript_8346/g.20023  ORF Transcript_8346/g.20023 Transcript_8346/m.20023 type:complete len:267 (-) Transcript_8346:1530-2330(-)
MGPAPGPLPPSSAVSASSPSFPSRSASPRPSASRLKGQSPASHFLRAGGLAPAAAAAAAAPSACTPLGGASPFFEVSASFASESRGSSAGAASLLTPPRPKIEPSHGFRPAAVAIFASSPPVCAAVGTGSAFLRPRNASHPRLAGGPPVGDGGSPSGAAPATSPSSGRSLAASSPGCPPAPASPAPAASSAPPAPAALSSCAIGAAAPAPTSPDCFLPQSLKGERHRTRRRGEASPPLPSTCSPSSPAPCCFSFGSFGPSSVAPRA